MNEHVWVAEAYKDGERIERLVHKNQHDAREDIEITTGLDEVDEIRVEKERLYLGESTDWRIER